MDMTLGADTRQSLEQFRHLLFHLQLECGSIHQLLRFFETQESHAHFDALKALDPQLMPQLLAREYVIEARQAGSPEKARQHLETALSLDPCCPEACMELAGLAPTPEAAMMWYQRSMDASESLLGKERLAALLAEFHLQPWKQVETITYLKAKVNLAETLFRNGYYEVAALHFSELIAIHPADELSLRHFLLTALLCQNRLAETQALLARYPEDLSAKAFICRAFLRFKKEGDSRRSRRSLVKAFRRNMWVPVYLLGMEKLPPTHLLDQRNGRPLKAGSRLEAADCVKCTGPAFCEDTSLVLWAWEVLRETVDN